MSTTALTDPVVVLDPDRVEQLCHLLGTVEDWLLHCSAETLDDLGGFLAGLSWAPPTAPERLAANLVHDLGENAVALQRAMGTAPQATIVSGPLP